MTCLIVVPARWGSSRLPGKPLIPIAGRTLLSRVVDLARRACANAEDVSYAVATDDERVGNHARDLGCRVVMTDAAIASGSGRVLAAALRVSPTPRHVLNLQGDAPFVPVEAITGVLAALRAGAQVATPVIRLDWPALDRLRDHKARAPFSGTTCVFSPSGRALWFSKAILPAIRNEADMRRRGSWSPVYRHLGVYGYELATLKAFEALPVSSLEKTEGLEQLRFLEAGIPVQTVELRDVPDMMGGIDTMADVALAERLLSGRERLR